MKLQVTQENFSKALNNVAKVASGRNTLPILSNVLIKTVDNRVCIAATNLNIAITHYIGSKVGESGAITVPARLAQDFVSSLPSGVIDLRLDGTKLHIKTDKHNSVINGTPADDFPIMPQIKKGTSWSVSSRDLKNALNQVVFSASNDDTRPILTGVNFHTKAKNLYVVATDSYRLSEKKIGPINVEININIPSSAIVDLLRVIDDNEEEVKIINDDQQVLFKKGDIELVTRLIDGTFPDYRKLIPSGNYQNTATVKKPDLTNIVKVSSLFARENAGSIVVEVSQQDNQISVRSVASQLGENIATADADASGEGQITLNSKYVSDGLAAIEAKEVFVGFNGKLDPVILTGKGDKDYTHVIMPLKS